MEERLILTPKEEIEDRLTKLRVLIEKESMDAAFFHYKVDYYYLSGTMQDALLYVPSNEEPVLFVKREISRAKAESPLKHILEVSSYKEIKRHIPPLRTVGLQIDVMPYLDVVNFKNIIGFSEVKNSSDLVKRLRKKKSQFEIMLLEKASEIQKKVYEYLPSVLKEGMTEIELGGILEAYAKSLGHEGILRIRSLNYEPYSWHILSGESGSIVGPADSPMTGLGLSPAFPVGASFKKIREGEPILVDFGVSYHGYHVDQTRIFAIGKIPKKFFDAYEVSREIQNRILELIPRGATSDELFRIGKKIAEKYGYGENYLGYEPFKVRFVGHGVGLELSESPFIAENHEYPIDEGSVFALEPKMVFKGEGACGIENTIVYKDGRVRIITDNDEKICIV
ncbi:MAG: Xaa-Pro peptidase family protein [Desulfobacterota bacterium]|nr:Xaa-Pro peptidase family protein [Thermodesulfobacteriota bacterium]MDW8001085.1 Xaa-Pro peptidase family protein [Deltaproteobacteria bacterium]